MQSSVVPLSEAPGGLDTSGYGHLRRFAEPPISIGLSCRYASTTVGAYWSLSVTSEVTRSSVRGGHAVGRRRVRGGDQQFG
jgi:hypothetical protein